MMKKLLTVVVLGLSALSFNAAFAHGGGAPKHGGVVATASDLSFELVGSADVRSSTSRTMASRWRPPA